MNEVIVAGGRLRHFHIAAFFRSRDEQFEVLRSYITEGIQAGEKTLHICDPGLKHDHAQRLEGLGVPVRDCTRTGQLEVLGWDEAHIKGGGFDADTMLSMLEEVVRTSHAEGFPRVRIMGEMEWALDEKPSLQRVVEYESRVNLLLNRIQQPAICVYDLQRFSGSVVIDVLRTHPYALIEGELRENPFYVPPEEFLGRAHPLPRRA